MSKTFGRQRRAMLTSFLIVLVASLGIAACGDDDDDAGAENGAETSLADFEAQLEDLYSGTYTAPPESSPTPEPGKKVFIIPIILAGGTAALSAEEAAESLDWDATVIDGKADPAIVLGAIRQAIAADADGIFLYAVDCPLVRSGLEAAKRAGIPVVNDGGVDCNELKPGAPSLFTYTVDYAEGKPLDYFEAWGRAQATWLIAESGGDAKVIHVYETDVVSAKAIGDGFQSEFKKCSGCEIVETIEAVVTDLGPTIQQKIEQALLRNPDADSLALPYDAFVTSGGAAAVRASGRAADILVLGGEGQPANIELVREGGGQSMGVGESLEWEGYTAMDALNRLFAGEDPNDVETGLGLQVYDQDHNLPPEGEAYQPPVDFKSAFEQAWGTE